MWASFVNAFVLLPEFECKPGSLIECELRGHDRKFLGFLLVGAWPGGAWIKVECLATSDSWFLTWCDSHGGDGRSLSLHLCASPPETCSCTDGQKAREFYSESWRRITRENVAQGYLSWNLSGWLSSKNCRHCEEKGKGNPIHRTRQVGSWNSKPWTSGNLQEGQVWGGTRPQ